MKSADWEKITLEDVVYAYRKAKADCFYERSIVIAERFVEYEEALSARLVQLTQRLRNGEIEQLIDETQCDVVVTSKRLSRHLKNKASVGSHSYFSDSGRAFAAAAARCEHHPEFRLLGDFSVEAHVISALWINMVGHRFDAILSASAYGSRVRRYSLLGDEGDRVGGYHIDATGSFEPYFEPYKAWRDNGMQAIKTSLAEGQPVIAVTLDFSSYYQSIDPAFLLDLEFLEKAGVTLQPLEVALTSALLRLMKRWSEQCRATAPYSDYDAESEPGGLPIGLSAVRIISNALLFEFDASITQQLAPLYYGRYVDDMFLVLRDPGHLDSADTFWRYLVERCSVLTRSGDDEPISVNIGGSYLGRTRLQFQPEKQRVFFLESGAGMDLLNNIAAQIRNLSSERRLMPNVDELDSSYAAKVLVASESSSDDADSLRRADDLTVRRLGWALQLRSIEILARDLDPKEWAAQRRKFYEFAIHHVIRPDRLLEQLDVLPRLVGVAVSQCDWREASLVVRAARNAVFELRQATYQMPHKANGREVADSGIPALWEGLKAHLDARLRDVTLRALPLKRVEGKRLSRSAIQFFRLLDINLSEDQLQATGENFRKADWAKTSYKDHLRRDGGFPKLLEFDEDIIASEFHHENDLRRFLAATFQSRVPSSTADRGPESILPYIFPTRPYSAREVALLLPDECVFAEPEAAVAFWATHLRAVRGNWARTKFAFEDDGFVPATAVGDPSDKPLPPARNHAFIESADRKITLGISSILTTEHTWARSAAGSPDLSLKRYKRLSTVVNQAIRAENRPKYLLLPELSMPEAWLSTFASILQESGINLVAGLDYTITSAGIVSEVALVLSDNRLGYPSSVEIRQAKAQPAPNEEEHLYSAHGHTWNNSGGKKPVYAHGDFYFAVLVCSELQNISYRHELQGDIDCLMVLSWNRDLDTFSALVEAASLDVHCHIALVNNRQYGDSRVRAPAKTAHQRDLCRVRGGLNDHLVVVELEIERLRKQQSRAKRWSRPDDLYKPAPEGYQISHRRKRIPD